MSLVVALSAACSAYLAFKLLSFRKVLRSIDCLTGYRHIFGQYSLIANLLSPVPFVNPGTNHFFQEKHRPFADSGWDITSIVHLYPKITVALVVADVDIAREVLYSRARFPKAVELYERVCFYGPNIIASEGDEWKRFRKFSAPAFTDRNNRLVWDETIRTLESLSNYLWKDQGVISVDNFVDITIPFSLSLLAVASFGKGVSWGVDDPIPVNHRMSFKEALTLMCTDVHLLFLPDLIMGMTDKTRKMKIAYDELAIYIQEMIHERRSKGLENKVQIGHDLLSNLVQASLGTDSESSAGLSEEELIGNIYIFLLAGHEVVAVLSLPDAAHFFKTSAHTLCFVFGLLALYQEEQEKLYDHICSVVGDGNNARYADMPKFTYALAVLYETLRMFPAAVNYTKYSAEDTTFLLHNSKGDTKVVPVPKDARIFINSVAIHYNPRYWTNPHSFNPSRFMEEWNKDAFIPFAAGSRACIGRRFFETSAIAALVNMVSKYKITIKEEPQFAKKTFEERKERVLRTFNGITLTPCRMPLTFTRRSRGQ